MDEKEQKVITFKLSAEEAEALDAKANQAGMSRSDYLRMVLFTPPEPTSNNLETLIKHALYRIDQVHNALYSIAEGEGKVGRFLSTDELQEIYDHIKDETVKHARELPNRLAAMQAKIAAASEKVEA